MASRRLNVCVIGAGPRGISVLERICANARDIAPDLPVLVHVIDPHRPGAGQVWRTNQSGHLLMNTVASQVTLFTDASVHIDGPVLPGPSLYEWASFLTLMGSTAGYPDDVMAEALGLGPDSYPTRAFYGHYLEWVFRRVVGTASDRIDVRVHRSRAVSLDDDGAGPDGPQVVRLADGTRLAGLDAVVLAQGHVGTRPTDAEAELATFAGRHGLTYVPPANPADVDLSVVRPGEAVILRGLGLNFFDHMALLTLGRGGRFERRDGRLVYHPSGREPLLYAGSRRGVPYSARGENAKGATGRHTPAVLTPAVIAGLRERARNIDGIDFRRDLWPLIAREVEAVYYTTLLSTRDCDCTANRFRDRVLAHPVDMAVPTELLDEFGIEPADRWEWDRVAQPFGTRSFRTRDEFRECLLDHLRDDVVQAHEGNVRGPVKAALDVLRDLRNEIRLVVDHGGLAGRSHRDDLEGWYTPLNAFLSIGPPVSRIEEMIALVEARILTVLGPDIRLLADPDLPGFVAESPRVPGFQVHATAVIEARLPEPDLSRTTDPLLRQLLATGQCTPYTVTDPAGDAYRTGGLAVTERPYHLVDAAGRAHRRRFACGVPTESVHWVTAAGVRPGVDSVTLGDSDSIARTALSFGLVRCATVQGARAA